MTNEFMIAFSKLLKLHSVCLEFGDLSKEAEAVRIEFDSAWKAVESSERDVLDKVSNDIASKVQRFSSREYTSVAKCPNCGRQLVMGAADKGFCQYCSKVRNTIFVPKDAPKDIKLEEPLGGK